MGWASGSELFDSVIDAAKKYVPKKNRKAFYKQLIFAFQDRDWDTEKECLGQDPLFDEVLREEYPDWFKEEDDE